MTYFVSGPTDEDRDREDQLNREEPAEGSRTYSDEAEEGAPRPDEDDQNPPNQQAPAEEDNADDDDDEED